MQFEQIWIENVLDDFDNLILGWLESEMKREKIPKSEGWSLIVRTFKNKRPGFTEGNIRERLRKIPKLQQYKNTRQEQNAKKRIYHLSKKSLLKQIAKKSIKELQSFAEPGTNMLKVIGEKDVEKNDK